MAPISLHCGFHFGQYFVIISITSFENSKSWNNRLGSSISSAPVAKSKRWGGNMEEEAWRGKHGGRIQEASGYLGIWVSGYLEASRGIWKHLEGIWMHLGSSWKLFWISLAPSFVAHINDRQAICVVIHLQIAGQPSPTIINKWHLSATRGL